MPSQARAGVTLYAVWLLQACAARQLPAYAALLRARVAAPLLTLLCACGDPCQDLCVSVARELDDCMPDWGLTWEDLGAETRAAWRLDCQSDWSRARATLEARQVPAAESTCEEAEEDLTALTCDDLRAMYVLAR